MTISQADTINVVSQKAQNLPQKLENGFVDKFEKLSREQAGYLRHFHNLATQRDGDWGLMGSQEPDQEWLDGYRYQLATMAYAAGAAHYHRLPALRSTFKPLLESFIRKMLHRDVWGYWFLTSHSGKFVDPDIKELRKPWADPIVRENIMMSLSSVLVWYLRTDLLKYSGHLHLMVSLYTMLFNDDSYNEPEALSFEWNPIFWGMGPEKFCYTRQSLQKATLTEMEREKWLGSVVNPTIIALRYNDIHDGTDVATEVLKKYTAAWKVTGMTQEDGLFVNWYSPKQCDKRPARDVGNTAWGAAFMNAWNPEVAHGTFDTQAVGFSSRVTNNRVNVKPGPVAFAIRELLMKEGADPHSRTTILKAQEKALHSTGPPEPPFPRPLFGYVIKWVSEVGDQATLDGLFTHVDQYLNPTWQNGGLYYPVNPQKSDVDGNWTEVEPFTGNSAIGYARLNVFDGQRKWWLNPWTAEHVSHAPYIDGISLANGVDFLRGLWDESSKAMVVTMRSWSGNKNTQANI